MKILIVEPYYHSSYLYATACIAQAAGHNIRIITTSKVWSESQLFIKDDIFEQSVFDIYLVDDLEMLFKTAIRDSFSCDLIMFNTLQVLEWQNLFRLAFATWGSPVVFTIHNPLYWFEHPGYRIYRVRALLRLILRNQILRRFDGILFLSDSMVEYARQKGYQKPLGLLPYGVFTETDNSTQPFREPVQFAVPGTISSNRDYVTLLDAFQKASKSLPGKIRLELLGPPSGDYGEKIKERCEYLIRNGHDIKLSDERVYVSEKELAEGIDRADYLVLPVSSNVFPRGLKVTGTLYDAIRFSKPFIIPNYYILPSHLAGGAMTYQDTESLYDVFLTCVQRGSALHQQLTHDMHKNAVRCSPGAWREQFNSFCRQVLNSQ